MKLTDLLQDVGRPVAYYPRLAIALGGVKQAIFLCQMIYWDGKEANADGWIRKPQREITDETGLSREETDRVRAALVKAGLLEQTRFGRKGQLHFRVLKDALNDLWEKQSDNSCLCKPHIPVCVKPSNSIYTENTSENTSNYPQPNNSIPARQTSQVGGAKPMKGVDITNTLTEYDWGAEFGDLVGNALERMALTKLRSRVGDKSFRRMIKNYGSEGVLQLALGPNRGGKQ
jgi:hypothetical protein